MSPPSIRLYVDSSLATGELVTLSLDPSHYLCNVMRCKQGEQLALFNGRDGEWLAEIITPHKKHTVLAIHSLLRPQRVEQDIWLVFALVKNVALNFLAQKATELGVSALCPVITARTVVHHVNTEKLTANAIEAAEQSERLTIPVIHPLEKLEKLLATWPEDRLLIFCDESRTAPPAKDILPTLTTAKKYAILIGPEGGFSPHEQGILRAAPFTRPISLGPRILRADTAALAALAGVSMQCGDWA